MTGVPVARNQTGNIRERKLRDALCTSGAAVITFGIWSAIKGVIQVANKIEPLIEEMGETATTEEEIALAREALQYSGIITWIIVIIVVAFSVIEIMIRVYIGKTARSVGMGIKPIRTKWLAFSVTLLILELISLIYGILEFQAYWKITSISDYIVTIFVTATSLYATWELVYSGFSLKKLLKKKG